MAEVLIQFVDKVPSTDPKYVENYRIGDVIDIKPDGWGWTPRELTNPSWRVIKLPGIDPALLDVLLGVEFDIALGKIRNRRKQFVDSTKMTGAMRNQLNNNQVITLSITAQQLLNFTTTRL